MMKQDAGMGGINSVIRSAVPIYDKAFFAGVALSEKTLEPLEKYAKKPMEEREIRRLNRYLLNDAFPDELRDIVDNTTPAMRIGLARAPVSYKSILAFKG
jgi:hypothetical protein